MKAIQSEAQSYPFFSTLNKISRGKKYYHANLEREQAKARERRKKNYISLKKTNPKLSAFKIKQLERFLSTFGYKQNIVLERWHRKKKGGKWKGIKAKYNVFQILEKGGNYIVRLGIKGAYRDYYIGVIDIDGRGWTKVGTDNLTTYIKTSKGIHVYFLYETKKYHNVKLKLSNPKKPWNKPITVDFKINGFVLGAGSVNGDTGLSYELKGKGYNFFLGAFKSDVECLKWFVDNYQAKYVYKKQEREVAGVVRAENYQAYIEIPADRRWEELRQVWWKLKK